MSLFGKIFGSKKSPEQVLEEAKTKFLRIYGISAPTQEAELKTIVGLTIATIGMLNELGQGRLNHAIDQFSEAGRSLAQRLRVRLDEVLDGDDEQNALIALIPHDSSSRAVISVDGGSAFAVIFNMRGPRLVEAICQSSNGPLGSPGYAAVVLGDMVVGRERATGSFISATGAMAELLDEAIKSVS